MHCVFWYLHCNSVQPCYIHFESNLLHLSVVSRFSRYKVYLPCYTLYLRNICIVLFVFALQYVFSRVIPNFREKSFTFEFLFPVLAVKGCICRVTLYLRGIFALCFFSYLPCNSVQPCDTHFEKNLLHLSFCFPF